MGGLFQRYYFSSLAKIVRCLHSFLGPSAGPEMGRAIKSIMQKVPLPKGELNPGLLHDSWVSFPLHQECFGASNGEVSGILKFNRLGV